MTTNQTQEQRVKCPVDGCEETPWKRGLFIHVYQTDGDGHGERHSVPDWLDLEDVEVVSTEETDYDYPDEQDLGNEMRLDTYTGRVFEGKRGIMVHLGRAAGKNNIPEDVTDRHDAGDFPIVEVDDDGNILRVVKEGKGRVPPADTWLPEDSKGEEESIPAGRVRRFVRKLRDGSGAATADAIEDALL